MSSADNKKQARLFNLMNTMNKINFKNKISLYEGALCISLVSTSFARDEDGPHIVSTCQMVKSM